MKSLFITVRLDRMKNMDIVTLFHKLTTYSKNFTTNPDLLKAIAKLEMNKEQTEILFPKKRKQEHTAEITKLRASNDKLIAAMQYQLKALRNAAFEEDRIALWKLDKYLTKELKDYKRRLITHKKTVHYTLKRLADSDNYKNEFDTLGLSRYMDKLIQTDLRIDELLDKQKETRSKLPAPNTTIPTKEKLIAEIRFFLRTVEMHAIINPDSVETKLLNFINNSLKEARTQLRNTATRRIKRNEKKAEDSQDQDLQN